jgi:hypothetical protein
MSYLLLISVSLISCLFHSFIFQATIDRKGEPQNPKSWPKFLLRVDHDMCGYLTSGKKTKLGILSSSLKVWILLKVLLINRCFTLIIMFMLLFCFMFIKSSYLSFLSCALFTSFSILIYQKCFHLIVVVTLL